MKKLFIAIFLILCFCTGLKAQSKSEFSISDGDEVHFGLMASSNNKTYFDFGQGWVEVTFKNHKPVAARPYWITRRNHTLFIFKNGKKLGTYTMLKKEYQLTNLHSS